MILKFAKLFFIFTLWFTFCTSLLTPYCPLQYGTCSNIPELASGGLRFCTKYQNSKTCCSVDDTSSLKLHLFENSLLSPIISDSCSDFVETFFCGVLCDSNSNYFVKRYSGPDLTYRIASSYCTNFFAACQNELYLDSTIGGYFTSASQFCTDFQPMKNVLSYIDPDMEVEVTSTVPYFNGLEISNEFSYLMNYENSTFSGLTNQEHKFVVHLKSIYGSDLSFVPESNLISVTSSQDTSAITLEKIGDFSFLVRVVPTSEGQHQITVSVNSVNIRGSPFTASFKHSSDCLLTSTSTSFENLDDLSLSYQLKTKNTCCNRNEFLEIDSEITNLVTNIWDAASVTSECLLFTRNLYFETRCSPLQSSFYSSSQLSICNSFCESWKAACTNLQVGASPINMDSFCGSYLPTYLLSTSSIQFIENSLGGCYDTAETDYSSSFVTNYEPFVKSSTDLDGNTTAITFKINAVDTNGNLQIWGSAANFTVQVGDSFTAVDSFSLSSMIEASVVLLPGTYPVSVRSSSGTESVFGSPFTFGISPGTPVPVPGAHMFLGGIFNSQKLAITFQLMDETGFPYDTQALESLRAVTPYEFNLVDNCDGSFSGEYLFSATVSSELSVEVEALSGLLESSNNVFSYVQSIPSPMYTFAENYDSVLPGLYGTGETIDGETYGFRVKFNNENNATVGIVAFDSFDFQVRFVVAQIDGSVLDLTSNSTTGNSLISVTDLSYNSATSWYSVSYNSQYIGNFEIWLTIDGEHISGSPFTAQSTKEGSTQCFPGTETCGLHGACRLTGPNCECYFGKTASSDESSCDSTVELSIISAELTSTGAEVLVIFSGDTDRAFLDIRFSCSRIIVGFTSTISDNLLISEYCYWRNARTLVVKGEAFVEGASFTLLPLSSNIAGLGFTVTRNSQTTTPVAIISGTSVLTPCSNLVLDGSYSYLGGSRPLRYIWSISGVSNTDTNINSTHFGVFSDRSLSKGEISGQDFPTIDFINRATYTVTLTVVNLELVARSSPVTFTVQLESSVSPVVYVEPKTASFSVSDTFTVKSNVIWPNENCNASFPVGELIYDWTRISGPIVVLDPGVSDADSLYLASNTFTEPGDYVFEVRVALKSDPAIYSTSTVSVEVLGESVTAKIGGGNRLFTLGSDLVLDATSTVTDLDDISNYQFNWIARDLRTGLVVFGDYLDGPVITIPAVFLYIGTFKFDLVVTKGEQTSLASVTVDTSGNGPQISIDGKSVINSNEKLVLIGSSISNEDVDGIIEWTWSMSDPSGRVESLTKKGPNLALDSNYLTPGSLYTFRLTGTNNIGTSYTDFDVYVNEIPIGGSCVVNTGLEIAYETLFTVSCSEFSNPRGIDDSRFTLLYSAHVFLPGEFRTLVLPSSESNMIFTLPTTQNGTIDIEIQVQTGSGATAVLDYTINKPSIPAIYQDLSPIYLARALQNNQLEAAVASNDADYEYQSCAYILSLLSQEEATTQVTISIKYDTLNAMIFCILDGPITRESFIRKINMINDFVTYPDAIGSDSFPVVLDYTLKLASTFSKFHYDNQVSHSFVQILSGFLQYTQLTNSSIENSFATKIEDCVTELFDGLSKSMVYGEDPYIITSSAVSTSLQLIKIPSPNISFTDAENEVIVGLPFTLFNSIDTSTIAARIATYSINPYSAGRQTEAQVLSKIVEISLFDSSFVEYSVADLKDPITINISVSNAVQDPVCQYWDKETLDWSTEGCEVKSYSDREVICSCSHLTAFSIGSGTTVATSSVAGSATLAAILEENSNSSTGVLSGKKIQLVLFLIFIAFVVLLVVFFVKRNIAGKFKNLTEVNPLLKYEHVGDTVSLDSIESDVDFKEHRVYSVSGLDDFSSFSEPGEDYSIAVYGLDDDDVGGKRKKGKANISSKSGMAFVSANLDTEGNQNDGENGVTWRTFVSQAQRNNTVMGGRSRLQIPRGGLLNSSQTNTRRS